VESVARTSKGPAAAEGLRGLTDTLKRLFGSLHGGAAAASPTYDDFRSERYFRPLDGVRAISILLVLTWHVNSSLWSWLSGWEGPSIFFVISGFLITTLCLREEDRDGSVSLPAFYVRRACRILPLYYVVFLFYILVDVGLNHDDQRKPMLHVLPWYLSYMNDFVPNVADLGTPFRLSWTLGVEEKFYVFWPLFAFAILKGSPRLRVVTAAMLVAITFLGHDPGNYYLWYSQIMVGCLLALCLHHRPTFERIQRLVSRYWLVLAALVGAHVLVFSVPSLGLVLFAPAVALALAALVTGRPPWGAPLASRAMVYIGKRSYGVYLVNLISLSGCVLVANKIAPSVRFNSDNQPAAQGAWLTSLVLLAAVTLTSLLLAELLHRTIEAPMIARGRIWSKRITGRRPVAPPRMAPELEPEVTRVPSRPAEQPPRAPVRALE
jgi:peptidoglycan/LPS O-acetylase OafA/YrhL